MKTRNRQWGMPDWVIERMAKDIADDIDRDILEMLTGKPMPRTCEYRIDLEEHGWTPCGDPANYHLVERCQLTTSATVLHRHLCAKHLIELTQERLAKVQAAERALKEAKRRLTETLEAERLEDK